MANVAADLRQATVAVLRSWCHDFGLKPYGKKDDVIRQLCLHLGVELQAVDTEHVPFLQEEAGHLRHLEEVPIAAVRRRCRVKTREEDSLVPAVFDIKQPESRKRELSANAAARTNAVRFDTQSAQEPREPRREKCAETKKRQKLDDRIKTNEQCLRQQPEAKKCKTEDVHHAQSPKELEEHRQTDKSPNCNQEFKARCAMEEVQHCKQLDINFEKGTTNAQPRQEPQRPWPEKENVAHSPHEPDAKRQKETVRTRKKSETKRKKGKALAQRQRRSEQQSWPKAQQCQELLQSCNEEEIYVRQVLEAGHNNHEEDDAERQEALEEQLRKENEAQQQQQDLEAQRKRYDSCLRQESEDECSKDEEKTRCRQEQEKQRPIMEARLEVLSEHEKLHLGFKPEVRSRKDDGHSRSSSVLGELRYHAFETHGRHEMEPQSICKHEDSQLQAGWRDLALAATPNKRTSDAGRQWRSQWRRLSLLPAPEVPCSLSPLPGGDVWAAVAMRRAAEEGGKNAAASPGHCSVPRSSPGWSSVCKEEKEPLKTGDHFEDSEPSFDYGQMPTSQAAKKLVALSVAAAEMDETARCARLVDLVTGMIHSLPDDGIVAIGRSTGCDIVLAFPIIDDRHCVLLCNEGRVVVEDVGSKETFVNEMLVPRGDLLPQRVPLLRGDTLALAHPDGPKFLFLDGVRPSASSFGGA